LAIWLERSACFADADRPLIARLSLRDSSCTDEQGCACQIRFLAERFEATSYASLWAVEQLVVVQRVHAPVVEHLCHVEDRVRGGQPGGVELLHVRVVLALELGRDHLVDGTSHVEERRFRVQHRRRHQGRAVGRYRPHPTAHRGVVGDVVGKRAEWATDEEGVHRSARRSVHGVGGRRRRQLVRPFASALGFEEASRQLRHLCHPRGHLHGHQGGVLSEAAGDEAR
jgi:hypothetical protein